MKRLKLLFVLLVALIATSAKAESVQYLVLDLSDGSQTVVALADQPVITCQNGELKVTVAGEERVSALLSAVRQYRFSATPTSVQSLKQIPTSRQALGHVYIANAQEGETVRVFTINGRQVAQQRIAADGTADIDLTVLGKGLFIVKSKTTSIKVINK